ncbi:cellulase family protein [Grosmannia clavigera kw1407]|uniref:Cellulase family protein n=1 Tax=Grosmannia clavigera (strain kw1407 / UAMH 11150) TaxID=655863 RepID=F0XF10_GROCL|nr:cellulase family protein [Grosmannia clavigera kw1407]EFX04494.1 cellulase family protein [Grosmannia clavigera kw1407]
MGRLADNKRVIGADLRNEVRGLWGTMSWERWATAAEHCGKRLLALNPAWLIVVGGTGSGNDLSGVAARPVQLQVSHRVVYSVHVYGWSGWGSLGGRFVQRPYRSFAAAMQSAWSYLLESETGDSGPVPVWVAEFGAPHRPSVGDVCYWQHLLRFLAAVDADFGYWAVNPRKTDGSEETYKLVDDDWLTPVLDYRLRDLLGLG